MSTQDIWDKNFLYSEDPLGRHYLIIDFQQSHHFQGPRPYARLLRSTTELQRQAREAFSGDVRRFGGFLHGVYFDIVRWRAAISLY